MTKFRYLLVALLVTISVGLVNAQTAHKVIIKFSITLPSATVEFTADTLTEGELYVIKSHQLDAKYSFAQPLYDALVGSSFQFQLGALNDDVTFYFNLSDVTTDGKFGDDSKGSGFFFKANFLIQINGVYQSSPFNFANGKYAVLTIKRTQAFSNFLTSSGFNLISALSFLYDEGNSDYISSGITTEITDTTIVAKISHFSKVVGGNKDQLTAVNDKGLNSSVPSEYSLKQNYPNPFNPSTTIDYALPQRSYVELNVYNVLGVKVATLVKGTKDAGFHSVNFKGENLSTGLYIYELKTNNFVKTRKMMYLK